MERKQSGNIATTRDIAFVVFPGFQIQDLSGPLAAFEVAGNIVADSPYRIHVVSQEGGPIVSSCGLEIGTHPIRQEACDTLIVTGGRRLGESSELIWQLCKLIDVPVRKARRVGSVCTGAFILAASGLLDGRRAATHWQHAARLQKLFPRIMVEDDCIFVRDGNIWTSAGISAGIDLALAMIEEDLGPDVSLAAARTLVVYHRRPGSQSQFSAMLDMEPHSDRIRDVLTFMREHLTETLSTNRLAAVACLSPRQFGRVFRDQTGETPAKAIERLRAEVARPRVERGVEPIEVIAHHVGFVDPDRMRRAFIRVFGHPPQSIRRLAANKIVSGDRNSCSYYRSSSPLSTTTTT
jgi:transcriptional regulator GlxA family with amidase domain